MDDGITELRDFQVTQFSGPLSNIENYDDDRILSQSASNLLLYSKFGHNAIIKES